MMKKSSLLFIIAFIPVLLLATNNDCDQMVKNAREHKKKGKLELALGEFISALNCDPNIGADIAEEIQTVFDDINRQKERALYLLEISNNLLSFFFYEESINAAWALGVNGKYAVINRDGVKQTESVWENPQPFQYGRAIAQKGGEYYFINERGEVLSNEGYDFVHPTTLGHYLGVQSLYKQTVDFVVDSVRGTKKERIRFLPKGFEKADENFFPFQRINKKWGLMDTLGIIKAKAKYDTISKVYGGYARCGLNDKWGYLDSQGNTPAWGEIKFDSLGNFEDNIAWRALDGEFSLIILNKEGGSIYPKRGKNLLDLYEQYFSEHIYNQDWHYSKSKELQSEAELSKNPPINALKSDVPATITRKKGKIQHVTLYQYKDKLWVLDQAGDSLAGPYDEIERRPDTSLAEYEILITKKRAQYGLLVFKISPSGNAKLVRELVPNYESLGAFQDDQKVSYIRVKRNKKWGYIFWDDSSSISPNLDISIPIQYDLATNFFNNPDISGTQKVARVYVDAYDLYFYITTEGKMIADIVRNKIW